MEDEVLDGRRIPYDRLLHIARETQFEAVGVSVAERVAPGVEEGYRAWLGHGYHGEMAYLARNVDKRMDPRLLVRGARSIISLLVPYKSFDASESECSGSGFTMGKVASFALLRDYHVVMKERLYALLGRLRDEFGDGIAGRPFVDSAPLLDRYWAEKAGLGWLGKNSLLVTRDWGSYVFIGTLVVNVAVESASNRMRDHCGSCRRCVEACPTGALIDAHLMDARRCISYLTIEKKQELSGAEEASLGTWAFGCDVCQNVCPWNARSKRKDSSVRIEEEYVSRELLEKFVRNVDSLPEDTCLRRADPGRLKRLLGKSRD